MAQEAEDLPLARRILFAASKWTMAISAYWSGHQDLALAQSEYLGRIQVEQVRNDTAALRALRDRATSALDAARTSPESLAGWKTYTDIFFDLFTACTQTPSGAEYEHAIRDAYCLPTSEKSPSLWTDAEAAKSKLHTYVCEAGASVRAAACAEMKKEDYTPFYVATGGRTEALVDALRVVEALERLDNDGLVVRETVFAGPFTSHEAVREARTQWAGENWKELEKGIDGLPDAQKVEAFNAWRVRHAVDAKGRPFAEWYARNCKD